MDKLKNNLLDTLITLLLLKDFYTQLIGMGSYINRVVKFLGILTLSLFVVTFTKMLMI